MASNKDTAVLIYAKHIALASQDGRLFRKTVMDEIMSTCNCSLAAAATFYNNAKKAAPVEGLGRAAVPKGVVRPGSGKAKPANNIQDDDDCFTVLEIDGEGAVARCQSFSMQGDASEKFDDRVMAWPHCTWVMIQGLGPNSGDKFKLTDGEKEIKRHAVAKVEAPAI